MREIRRNRFDISEARIERANGRLPRRIFIDYTAGRDNSEKVSSEKDGWNLVFRSTQNMWYMNENFIKKTIYLCI